MKHRKKPLDLGDGESASSSAATSQQPSSTKRKKLDTFDCGSSEPKFDYGRSIAQQFAPNLSPGQKLSREISELFVARESLCGDFFTGKTDIPELCLSLDDIGKGFEKISVFSQYNDPGKSSDSNPPQVLLTQQTSQISIILPFN